MRYVALVDGKPGAYGVVFPDCPGCTAMVYNWLSFLRVSHETSIMQLLGEWLYVAPKL